MSFTADSLALPVFPLTGTLLLPGNYLPLNVFEERYRNMVADVLDADRTLGMIQPKLPGPDNFGVADEERPDLYSVGCAGRIEECEAQADGRYLIVLKGTCRFRVRSELETHRGYRRVIAGFDEFVHDLRATAEVIDRELLLAAVVRFSREHGLDFDQELLDSLPSVNLLHAVSAALPFEPAEKQALLEATSATERQETLLALMGMGLDLRTDETDFTPPVVH